MKRLNATLNGDKQKCGLKDHYVIVATKPCEPGAYASCVDDPKWLGDWAVERLLEGGILERVHCDRAHRMMLENKEWSDRQEESAAELKRVKNWVDQHRAEVLAKPLPRNQCPGCFSIIYDGAAEQGWCCNCFDHRAKYS